MLLQSPITLDINFASDCQNTHFLGSSGMSNLRRHRPGNCVLGIHEILFEQADTSLLASPTAWLNDVCINGGALLLQGHLSSSTSLYAQHSQQCAVLSSFDLLRIRYNRSDDDIWNHTRGSRYWEKNIWILPIHRPDHWVLCVASVSTRNLLLFDSLGTKQTWQRDIPVSIIFAFTSLVLIYN
jgi:hypothetical protein